MIKSVLAGLLALLCASVAATADTWSVTIPDHQLQRDTAEYDKVAICGYHVAQTYRYDFDHLEMPAADQALALFYRECRSEITALIAANPNWTAYTPKKWSFKSFVEYNTLIDFVNARSNAAAAEVPSAVKAPSLDAEILERYARWARYRHPSPLSADEIVNVRRRDAYGYEPTVSFEGSFEGWRYRYDGGAANTDWTAWLTNDTSSISVACHNWGPPETACRIDIGRYLSLGAGGSPFAVHAVCDPGGFGIVADTTPSISAEAREATVAIDDGTPIALPNGDGCISADDAQLTKRIAAAQSLKTAFKPPFSNRFVHYRGSSAAIEPALKVARVLYEIARDANAGARIRSEIATFVGYTDEFTLSEALQGELEWDRALDCYLRHQNNRSSHCLSELRDLDWRAAVIGKKLAEQLAYDNPGALPTARARIAEAREALAHDADLPPSFREPLPEHFQPGERQVSVAGAPGWRGFTSLIESYDGPLAYGYRLSATGAIAFIPGSTERDDYGQGLRSYPTLSIECAAGRRPSCRIRIPFLNGPGAFVIETDGGRADAKVCVRGMDRSIRGWSLAHTYVKGRWKLQDDGCALQLFSSVIVTGFMDVHYLALLAPGEDNESFKHATAGAEIHLALALSSYLSRRLRR